MSGVVVRQFQDPLNAGWFNRLFGGGPTHRVWFPGMDTLESVAACVFPCGGGEEVDLGRKTITYFPAGRLPEGEALWVSRASWRHFFERIHRVCNGSEEKSFVEWQGNYPKIEEIARRLERRLTPIQYQEIARIFSRSSRNYSYTLEEIFQGYFFALDTMKEMGSNLMGHRDFDDLFYSILFVATQMNRPIAEVARGYFEYGRHETVHVAPFSSHWENIALVNRSFSEKRFEEVVRDYFEICAFAKEKGIEPSSLWRKGSIFLDSVFFTYVEKHHVPLSTICEKYQEALLIKKEMRARKMARNGLTTNDLIKILLTVVIKREQFERKRKRKGKAVFHISSSPTLPRSLLFFSRGEKVLILLNKRRNFRLPDSGVDDPIGWGSDVIVKETWDIVTNTPYAIAMHWNPQMAAHEIRILERLMEKGGEREGIVSVLAWIPWRSKSGWDPKERKWTRELGCVTKVEKMGIVMSRYEIDLYYRMQRLQALSWEEKREFACELLEALATLHRCGIIHGDLYPPNIFLDEKDHPKIGDLRRSHIEGEEIEKVLGGAWIYQAPEYFAPYSKAFHAQKQGGQDVQAEEECRSVTTKALDIWAVGLILWQLFEMDIDGVPPYFGRMTWSSFVSGKRWENPFTIDWLPAPQTANEKGSIASIVRSCLQLDPSLRPTAHQLVADVAALSTPVIQKSDGGDDTLSEDLNVLL